VLLVGLEHLGGLDVGGHGRDGKFLGPGDAALEVADGGEVFVELAAASREASTSPLPKRRSKAARGLTSGSMGCVSDFQEMLNW
jgi:hypothetical protein